MAITCYLSGRWGNIVFALANMFAYAKKHGLKYYVPDTAMAYNHFRNGDIRTPIVLKSTGEKPINPPQYNEPYKDGHPYYHEIPPMDNIELEGYYQSFKYFDWCRDYILETFDFPYMMNEGVISISVRRGDCIGVAAFPIAPSEYYHNAIEYMQEKGYSGFKVHSDDQEWCRQEFTSANYPNAFFEFSEGDEVDDFISISWCEHNITARSTFSLTAAWFNRNPNKIVLVPQEEKWWKGQNLDLIPDYFTQIKFNDDGNSLNNIN